MQIPPSLALPCLLTTFQAFMMYIYDGLDLHEKCQKTTYVMQFLWRELSSDFDVIGLYFTCPSTTETRFLHSVVTRTMLAFTQFGFPVRALLCDGASTYPSPLKLMCGHSNDLDTITPWFTSPFDGKSILDCLSFTS